MTVRIPPSAGRESSLLIYRAGQPSNIVPYYYAPPAILSVLPTELPVNGGEITITGENFGPSWIEIGAFIDQTTTCTTTSHSQTKITCVVPAGYGSTGKQISVSGYTN